MTDLTNEEIIEIEGGDKKRNTFDMAAAILGGAVAGVAGAIAGWFSN